jgi:FkbM family methyltransferase
LLSFEPQSGPFETLARRAAADPGWTAFRVALGPEPGSATMQVAANRGQSSSLLPMLPLHEHHAPGARIVGTESVEVEALSNVLRRDAPDAKAIFLKLDVQGYELAVLDGCAAGDLERIVALEVELSAMPFYEGQPLLDEVIVRLYERGFRLTSFDPVWVDRETGFCLQADGIFVRERLFEVRERARPGG